MDDPPREYASAAYLNHLEIDHGGTISGEFLGYTRIRDPPASECG